MKRDYKVIERTDADLARFTINYMTSGQVAKICSVSGATVNNWCDNGLLPCTKIPGSKHRRIREKDLANFLAQMGIPLAKGFGHLLRVLALTKDEAVIKAIRGVSSLDIYHAEATDDPFTAGKLSATLCPDLVVVDFTAGEVAAWGTVAGIYADRSMDRPETIALLPFGTTEQHYRQLAAREIVRRPFDPQLLAARIRYWLTKRQPALAGAIWSAADVSPPSPEHAAADELAAIGAAMKGGAL